MNTEEIVKAELAKITKHVDEKFKEQQQHITSVEAALNTARPSVTMPGGDEARMLNGILPEHRYGVEQLDARGDKNPATKAFLCTGTHLRAMAMLAGLKGQHATAEEYQKKHDLMHKLSGFEDALAKAAVGEGAAGGGNIIPLPVERIIARMILDNSAVQQIAQHVVMNAPQHRVPTEANNIAVSITAEGATIPDSVATTQFGQVLLVAKKVAGLATCSNELLETNIVGLTDYLFTAMAEQVGRTLDFEAFDGTGVNWTGLAVTSGVNSITVSGTAASGGVAPSYADLVSCMFGAKEASTRRDAVWIMHPGAMKRVVQLVSSDGMPIFMFHAGVPGAVPMSILGAPVFVSSAISVTNTLYTSSTNIYYVPRNKILFGELGPQRLDIDVFGLFDKYQTRLRLVQRAAIVTPVGKVASYLKGVAYS